MQTDEIHPWHRSIPSSSLAPDWDLLSPSARDLLVQISPQGSIVHLRGGTGLPFNPLELTGAPGRGSGPDLTPLRTFFQELHTPSSKPLTHELCITGKTGPHFLDLSVTPLQQGHHLVLIRDMTERKRLEHIAEGAVTMNNISTLFTGIRHEIGNPLHAMKMTLSVLRDNLGIFPPEQILQYVERCLKSVGRIEFLLRSLKNHSLYDRIEWEKTPLKQFFNQFLSLIQDDASSKGIALSFTWDQKDQFFWTDPHALQQVLFNLVGNAIQALEGQVSPHLDIRVQHQTEALAIEILDNGAGLTPEQERQVFTPFFTTKTGGTGLGLAISRKILHRMNATLSLLNRKEGGCCARILLPDPQNYAEEQGT